MTDYIELIINGDNAISQLQYRLINKTLHPQMQLQPQLNMIENSDSFRSATEITMSFPSAFMEAFFSCNGN